MVRESGSEESRELLKVAVSSATGLPTVHVHVENLNDGDHEDDDDGGDGDDERDDNTDDYSCHSIGRRQDKHHINVDQVIRSKIINVDNRTKGELL